MAVEFASEADSIATHLISSENECLMISVGKNPLKSKLQRPDKVLGPHINVKVNQTLSEIAFLDSGSTISAISQEMANTLLEKKIAAVQTTQPLKLRSASDHFRVDKCVELEIDFGTGRFHHAFFVLPYLSKRILLGNDFLARTGIILVPAFNTVVCRNKKIPFVDTNAKRQETVDLHLVEHVDYIKDNYPIDPVIKTRFFELLDQHSEIFDDEPSEAKVTPLVINTETSGPVHQVRRLLNPGKRAIALKYTKEMLDAGVLQPSNSPWGSNYVFVDKPDGTKRPCGDFRKVNEKTVFDAYPMPVVGDVLNRISRAQVFSTFDLSKGFHQIPIDPADRPKTAIYTPLGLMEFVKMPFGLKNAAAVFQRAMEQCLGEYVDIFIMVYIDEVIIFSNTIEEHLEHLRLFFKKIREFNFRINPKKVQLCQTQIKVLGHIVEHGSCRPDPKKIAGIEDFPIPEKVQQLQSFLGSVNYYRRFVEHLAHVVKPLYGMTSPKSPQTLVWSPEALDAFMRCKKAMANLVIHMPDLNGEFIIQTDASGLGLGAVLVQVVNGERKPCSFISRNLIGAENNYSATELECLAVVWSVQKFRTFVECRNFVIETDHKALKWLMDMKDPRGRLGRWVMILQGYTFKIEHLPGKENFVADALSRNPVVITEVPDILSIIKEQTTEEIQLNKFPMFEDFKREQLIEAQKADSFCKAVYDYIKEKKFPENLPVKGKAILIETSEDAFIMEDGLIVKYYNPLQMCAIDEYNYERILAPRALYSQIFRRLHDDREGGHLGIDQTYYSVLKRFFFPRLYDEVRKYVASCDICQKNNYSNQKPSGLMQPVRIEKPFERLSVDLIGPMPKTKKGNEHALVVIDTASNWVEIFPLRSNQANASKCAELVLSVMSRYGFPRKIVSDNGSQFASDLWIKIMNMLHIWAVFTSPYHPGPNAVERTNRNIKVYLKKYFSDHQRNWDELIPHMLFALRNAKCSRTGLTPAQLVLGRNMRAPLDIVLPSSDFVPDTEKNIRDYATNLKNKIQCMVQYAMDNSKLAKLESKLYFDPSHKDVQFKEGDLVLLKTHILSKKAAGISSKLAAEREGPYVISRKVSPLNYELSEISTGEFVTFAHIVYLRKYVLREGQPLLSSVPLPVIVPTKPSAKPRLGIGKQRGRKPLAKTVPITPPVAPPSQHKMQLRKKK